MPGAWHNKGKLLLLPASSPGSLSGALWSIPFLCGTYSTSRKLTGLASLTQSSVAAALHTESGITIDLYPDASPEFLRNLIGAASHAEWCFRISQNISCYWIHGSALRHGRTGKYYSFPFPFRSLWQKYPVPVLEQENRLYQGTPIIPISEL